ncbi:AraC family transcriptional regulator [Enterovibrio norvegicus]|uniref:AraC family transcriptional regulator n=1 Tax=Enterovibrio norvegicus TaxID=188144 RepID=UPI00354D7105
MKPTIEPIDKSTSLSWHFVDYHCDHTVRETHCGWHYHNEIELVVYQDPHGVVNAKTVLGDYIGDAEHNCAYLMGPGLPHMISSTASATEDRPASSHVLWLDQCWLESLIATVPELSPISELLVRAHKGLKFSPQTGEKLHALMRHACDLKPSIQFTHVIDILLLLCEDKAAKPLTSRPYCFYVAKDTPINDKLEKAQQFIADHYHKPLGADDMCRHLHMSESSVYRMFEKHFSESFSDHLKRYRLGKACELLMRTKTPIAVVAEKVGFSNLSNFNRQFKAMKNMTPMAFRTQFL